MPTDTHSSPQVLTQDQLSAVSLSDAGAFESIAALHRDGIAVEAVVASVEEAEALAASRYGSRVARVRIDLSQVPDAWVRREGVAIRATLQASGVTAPRSERAASELAAA